MSAATVAIAPFENLSGDPAQDYFARGFVEDVATELSRFGTLEVLHPRAVAAALWTAAAIPSAAFRRPHRPRQRPPRWRRRPGQRPTRRSGNGRQVWADRYDATAS